MNMSKADIYFLAFVRFSWSDLLNYAEGDIMHFLSQMCSLKNAPFLINFRFIGYISVVLRKLKGILFLLLRARNNNSVSVGL